MDAIRQFIQSQKKGCVMSLVTIIITLVIVGVVLWLVNTYIPMDGKIKTILNVVVVIAVLLWLLSVSGAIGSMSNIRIGK